MPKPNSAQSQVAFVIRFFITISKNAPNACHLTERLKNG